MHECYPLGQHCAACVQVSHEKHTMDWWCLIFEKLLLLLLLPLKVLSAGAFRSLGSDMDRCNIDFEEVELTQPRWLLHMKT